MAREQRMEKTDSCEWGSRIKAAVSLWCFTERVVKGESERSCRGNSFYLYWWVEKWDLGLDLPLVICVVLFQRVGSLLTHKHRGNIDLLHNIHCTQKCTKLSVQNITSLNINTQLQWCWNMLWINEKLMSSNFSHEYPFIHISTVVIGC